MRILTAFILTFISIISFAQKKFEYKDRHFPAKYVLRNSKDTINTRIMNVGITNNNKYSVYTWVNKMVFVDENGNRKIMKEDELDYLEIHDLDGKVHQLYSSRKYMNKDVGLVEVLYHGKMSCLRDTYYINIYGNLGSTDYYVEKNSKPIQSGLFIGLKKQFAERFANYPDLMELLDKWKSSEDLINILEEYNKK